jgi:two-component system response regulator VanR
MRVLVVDDERVLADYVAAGLRRTGMAVDVSYRGGDALERLYATDYDAVVLDRDLPDVPGDDVCRQVLRDRSRTRILMLTAAGSVRDRVEGLGLGADDYLAKPFDHSELVARLQALGRRTQPAVSPVLERHDLRIDTARRQAYRAGRYLPLSRKELAVLEILVRADGAPVSAEDLLERAWDEHADPFTSAVRVLMCKLRAKLGDPQLIETLPGVGYRI